MPNATVSSDSDSDHRQQRGRLHSAKSNDTTTPSTVSDRLQSILTTTAPPNILQSHHSDPFPGRLITNDKRVSRSLSLALSANSCGGTGSSDRGMLGLARRANDSASRNVAVVGKTYLKILKVPLARTASSTTLEDQTPYSTGGARRPRTRAHTQEEGDSTPSQVVEEVLDVRSGARLGPSYLFSDVKWGYGATSNKLGTALSNGSVVLWDLEAKGPNKVDQLKYEHDRAVNSIIFGGASGSWLMSGGQDGLLKLWDIREAKPASLILKASSPVHRLSFSPSSTQPFSLLAVCASGTMIRYDIRYTGRGGGGATDRIAGHVGACLAMDWRESLDSDYVSHMNGEEVIERKDGGYVATAGMDGTIKIWDFSLASLSVKPLRTLRTGRPVKDIKWAGGQKILACSLPSLSLGRRDEDDGEEETSAGDGIGRRISSEVTNGSGADWRNEIEIWDISRESFPQRCIKTLQPTSAVLYNDDDTIWSSCSTSATFRQHDLNTDTYALLHTFPRPAAAWNLHGELAFIEEPSRKDDKYQEPNVLTGPAFRPATSIASISHFDPDHDRTSFELLANHYISGGKPFGEICDINTEVAKNAHRLDAAELWTILKIWFDDDPPPPTPTISSSPLPPILTGTNLPEADTPLDASNLPSPVSPLHLDEEEPSTPPITVIPLPPGSPRNRRSYSNPLSQTRSLILSPLTGPSTLDKNAPKLSDNATLPANNSTATGSSAPNALDFARHPASLSKQLNSRKSSLNRKTRDISSLNMGLKGKHSQVSSDSDSEALERERTVSRAISSGSYRAVGVASPVIKPSTSIIPTLPKSQPQSIAKSKINQPKKKLPSISLSSSSSTNTTDSMMDSGEDEDGIEDDEDDEDFHDDVEEGNRQRSRTAEDDRAETEAVQDLDEDDEDESESSPKTGLDTSMYFRRFSGGSRLNSATMTTIGNTKRRSSFGHHLTSSSAMSMPTSPFIAEGGTRVGSHHAKGKTNSLGNEKDAASNGMAASASNKLPPAIYPSRSKSRAISQSNRIASELKEKMKLEEQEKLDRERRVKDELRRIELIRFGERKRVADLREGIKRQIKSTLESYAEQGDTQLCAIVCCVLHSQSIDLDFAPLFVARLSKAYLDLLRGLELYTASAGLIKYCQVELLKSQAQQNIVFHTSCQCGKVIEQPPYDLCRRCNKSTTLCIICHLKISSLLTLCTLCNHVAHPACINAYYSALSPSTAPLRSHHSSLTPILINHEVAALIEGEDGSHPSTPGFLPPVIRTWMYGEGDGDQTPVGSDVPSTAGGREEEAKIWTTCPKGDCDCVGCPLSLANL